MTSFTSFREPIEKILSTIVECEELHAKWLNTLSFLENCGAKKIAACEHPTLVKEEMLKHAAEEFRHAHHLKRQIAKVFNGPMDTYSRPLILGGQATLHYLPTLNVKAVRYLKSLNYSPSSLKEAAYLLVTYAIELRAEELYPLYEETLRRAGSPVSVKSILRDEKEHLNEMKEGLLKLSSGFEHASNVSRFESHLCRLWLDAVSKSICN